MEIGSFLLYSVAKWRGRFIFIHMISTMYGLELKMPSSLQRVCLVFLRLSYCCEFLGGLTEWFFQILSVFKISPCYLPWLDSFSFWSNLLVWFCILLWLIFSTALASFLSASTKLLLLSDLMELKLPILPLKCLKTSMNESISVHFLISILKSVSTDIMIQIPF